MPVPRWRANDFHIALGWGADSFTNKPQQAKSLRVNYKRKKEVERKRTSLRRTKRTPLLFISLLRGQWATESPHGATRLQRSVIPATYEEHEEKLGTWNKHMEIEGDKRFGEANQTIWSSNDPKSISNQQTSDNEQHFAPVLPVSFLPSLLNASRS